jgi:hypothetical protein
MAKTDLTAQRLRELLNYDPETGVFTWRVKIPRSKVNAGAVAGCLQTGYAKIKIDGFVWLGHRLAWLYVTGKNAPPQIDHIDGNRSNNRMENLRPSTSSENQQNLREARSNSKSGVLGVIPYRSGFRACIKHKGKTKYLGDFATKDEASAAYLSEKRIAHPFNTL